MSINSSSTTGSQLIIEALLREKVKIIFGYPGGMIAPVYDALYDYQDKIRHVLVRHEQGAGHAAEGYARITGECGVALVTSGPGATNLVTAIADAKMDSVPIVCISGQVAKNLLGTNAFQEVDIIKITAPITKWNYQITKASEIPQIFAKAFHISRTGRPGPVLIDITINAQVELCDLSCLKNSITANHLSTLSSNLKQIQIAAELLNNAKRPLMLIGQGVLISQAQKQVKQFLEKTGLPAAVTLHGISILPTNHPLYVGMLGMHGAYGANLLTNQADVILAIGMRFDNRVTGRLSAYAKQAKIIHIDIDPAELSKNVKAEVAIISDAKLALLALMGYVKKNEHLKWLEEFRSCNRQEYRKIIKHDIQPENGKILMGEVIDHLSKKTKNKDIVIIAGAGQHQMMVARYYHFQESNKFITSGGLGTMTSALPAAIGAKLAAPNKEVIVIIGDGSLQMSIQELATITQEQIAIKIVVLSNNSLGLVRQWQELFFNKRYSATMLSNPDFIAIAKGYHINGQKIEQRKYLDQGLDELLTANQSYLLEVSVKKEENVFPIIPSGVSLDEIWLGVDQNHKS